MVSKLMRAGVYLSAIALVIGCGNNPPSKPISSQQSIAPPTAELAHFRDVPYLWAQDVSRFSKLWARANTETVRVAVFGDSQETSPDGAGYIYMPRLNYEAWRRFGNVPETQVAGYGSYGGGLPWGDWLLSGAAASPGASTTRIHSTRRLPGMGAAAHSSLAGDRNINGQWYGQLTVLRQDSINVIPVAQVYTGNDYFCMAGAIRAEIFAATYPDSGEVSYRARPMDNAVQGDYQAPISAEGVLDMNLATSDFAVKSMMTPPLAVGGHRYLQLEVAGTDDAALTDIVGVRFSNPACPQGMVLQDFAAGGYMVTSFLNYNFDAGKIFRAFGFHAAILHLGANDAGQGVTAKMYQEQTEQLIAMLRTWVGDAEFPIVLMTDPYRKGLSAAAAAEFDHYAGAHLAIAQKDPNVLVLNSRRLMDDIGWNEARPDHVALVLTDDVHYTAQGAIELAAAEMSTLLGY